MVFVVSMRQSYRLHTRNGNRLWSYLKKERKKAERSTGEVWGGAGEAHWF